MPGGFRKNAGRKAVEIDLVELEKLCSLQCTDEEIAYFFGVTPRTIENRRKQRKFDDVMKRSKSCATASWAMSQDYETRYGIHCVPLIACHARDEGLRPEPKLRGSAVADRQGRR